MIQDQTLSHRKAAHKIGRTESAVINKRALLGIRLMRGGELWTPDIDEEILHGDRKAREIAKELGIDVVKIYSRKQHLKNKERKAKGDV